VRAADVTEGAREARDEAADRLERTRADLADAEKFLSEALKKAREAGNVKLVLQLAGWLERNRVTALRELGYLKAEGGVDAQGADEVRQGLLAGLDGGDEGAGGREG